MNAELKHVEISLILTLKSHAHFKTCFKLGPAFRYLLQARALQ